MTLSPTGDAFDSDQLQLLDRFLPEKVRRPIEENYYAKVSEQAQLDAVARNEEFLANPFNHVALFSDHGVVHVRDVATNILSVLDAIHGVLIPERNPLRLDFMKGYGVALAYNHDIGMRNFSAFGRAMHPEFAAQEVFTAAYDEIVDVIWEENWGNMAWRLFNLADRGALPQPPRMVLRELLSMSLGHSKSKVPMDALNDPAKLRQVMQVTLSTELHHLYHEQQVAKARKKAGPVQREAGFPAADEKAEKALQAAEQKHAEFLAANPELPRVNETGRMLYGDFDREAFAWLLSDNAEVCDLILDVTDTLRALRVADAFRQRGTTLKTSASYPIVVDQNTANAVFALQKGSGETFLVESDNELSAGEANIASTELTRDGDLRVSFQRGAFANRDTAKRGAHNVAAVIDDIQRDIIETFRRPAGHGDKVKDSQTIQILVEGTDDNLEFADLVLEALKAIDPGLGEKSRVVPSLKNVDPDERDRYLAATAVDWTIERRKKTLVRIAQSGHQIEKIDPDRAFTDVRQTTLEEGKTLLEAGAPPGFVFIPMDDGLVSRPLGGYQSFSVKPWIPIGNTRVIRGASQEATVTAERAVRLLMIPKEIYLKYWHDTYTVLEFAEHLPRAYEDEKFKGSNEILNILRQVAMIDATLDDAELRFISNFAKSYEIPFEAAEFRRELEKGGKADFVRLRRSVTDYLALNPPLSQVVRLRDLLNLFVKADEAVSGEEGLILSELMGMFAEYLGDEAHVSRHTVLIVPQSPEQDQAISSLFPDLPKAQTAGGMAYQAGAFYSRDYASMICERYRTLHFFTIVHADDGQAAQQ